MTCPQCAGIGERYEYAPFIGRLPYPVPCACLAAQGTEARRAETGNTDSVHDGPVAKPCAQPPSGKSL